MPIKKEFKIKLKPSFVFLKEIEWTLNVFSNYIDYQFEFVYQDEACDIDLSLDNSLLLYNHTFFEQYYEHPESSLDLLDESMNVAHVDGRIDLLSTAFYFLNCLWETDVRSNKDHWGRSEYEGSVWKRYGYNQPFKKVNDCFDLLAKALKISFTKRKSRVFLSHDIDVIYGAYKEDGLAILRGNKPFKLIRYIWEHLFRGPQWFNFRNIATIEMKYGMHSAFFWIPVKGKMKGIGKNADYSLSNTRIKNEIEWLTSQGFEHGIHKSLSKQSLNSELNALGREVEANRYHYLKFSFAQLKKEMNDSQLKIDASLGYAQVSGYRNGYTLPFIPFDLENRKPCTFIEVPLTLMDGTYSQYMKLNGQQALPKMIDFIEGNLENSVISILWHNSHFTGIKYKGFPEAYEALLLFLKKNDIETISIKQLIAEYSHAHNG